MCEKNYTFAYKIAVRAILNGVGTILPFMAHSINTKRWIISLSVFFQSIALN